MYKFIANKKNKKNKIIVCFVLIFCILISIIIYNLYYYKKNEIKYNDTIETLSKYGSSGSEVKYFQRTNGLTADSIAGSRTLKAMGIYSSSNSGATSSSSNLNLLSHLIYAEARGEPYTGQVAVGAVVLNRVKSSSFPNTVAGVIYQAGAFSVVSDGQINLTPDTTAKKAAQDALNGWDPTSGCIYYFNPNTATSSWIWSRPYVLTIGKHRFCK